MTARSEYGQEHRPHELKPSRALAWWRGTRDPESRDPESRDPESAASTTDAAWAIVGYFCAALASFVVPLAIYLLRGRRSRFVAAHAAQAVNIAITTALYLISAAIVGGMLALDSPLLGLRVGAGCALAVWISAVVYLTRAAIAARDGGFRQAPGWICATMLRSRASEVA